MRRFEDDRYYETTAPELAVIATRSTLNVWRHQGRGPRFTKVGRKVLYLGRDLNAYLDARVVEPAAA